MDNFQANITNTNYTVEAFPVKLWIIACYTIISFTGVIGNALVLSVIAKNPSMSRTSFGVYLGSLASADLLVALLCLPVYLTSTATFKHHPSGIGGDVMCKILSGYNILFLFSTVSVYTLVAISFERYHAICNPLSSRTAATPKRAKKLIAVIWVFSLILGINSIYGEEYATPDEATVGAHCKFSINYNSQIVPKFVHAVIFSVQYVFPVICMVFCFVKIQKELLIQNRKAKENRERKLQKAELEQLKQREKTIVTVIYVILAYLFLWTPNQIIYFCFTFNLFQKSWISNTVQSSVVLCFSTCCVNPFIYSFRSKTFRHGFKSTFKCYRMNIKYIKRKQDCSLKKETKCNSLLAHSISSNI